jgi:Extensin-like protein C-terminus
MPQPQQGTSARIAALSVRRPVGRWATLANLCPVSCRPPSLLSYSGHLLLKQSHHCLDQPVGVVCADPALVGVSLPSVVEENGCGMPTPIQLSAAAGVTLEPPGTITCEAGRAFAKWLRNGPVASFAALGQRLSVVTVVDAYSCRNRNRSANGKLSEHAFGRAIDIGGFRLGDGTIVTVDEGWTSPRWSSAL